MRIPGTFPPHTRMEFDVVIQMSSGPRPLSRTVRSQLHTTALEIERLERQRKLFQGKPIRNFKELRFGNDIPLRIHHTDVVLARGIKQRKVAFPYKFVCIRTGSLLEHRGAINAFSALGIYLEPRLHSLQGIVHHIASKQEYLRPLGGIADMVIANREFHALILDF